MTENKGEWIAIEEHNSKGQPIIPRHMIQATVLTTYNPEKHTDLNLLIMTGMAPEGALIGQYKMYDIEKFSMQGWRTEAEALIELAPARGYEKEWFRAFEGNYAEIRQPGLPGKVSVKYKMKITKTDFRKKIINYKNKDSVKMERKVFEAHLSMKETWKSALLRKKGELGRYLIATIIGTLIGAGITSIL